MSYFYKKGTNCAKYSRMQTMRTWKYHSCTNSGSLSLFFFPLACKARSSELLHQCLVTVTCLPLAFASQPLQGQEFLTFQQHVGSILSLIFISAVKDTNEPTNRLSLIFIRHIPPWTVYETFISVAI